MLTWARDHLAELQVAETIRNDVTEGVDKQQREFLLRQQLAAIRKELGEGDDDVVGEYRTKLESLEAADAARNFIAKEIDRLERTSAQSPEQGWIRTWLDRVFELPWGVRSDDTIDLTAAQEILDADHYGLADVKSRIVEFLAVQEACAASARSTKSAERSGSQPSRSRVDHHARRAARRRQDVARRVDRPGDGPQVRPRRPRRHPRRGRDPRPPPHVRRLAARAHRQGDHRGRHDEPRRAARRGRQARRRRVVGRSDRGPARGARPGAEPHVPRPLPRARPRPVGGRVHRHRQRARHGAGAAARPHGHHPPRRLHRRGEGLHRPPLPAAPAAQAGRARRRPS